ncbi:MAG: alpha/beta hydrolase domain-containing protein [Burkholderiales bacterium]
MKLTFHRCMPWIGTLTAATLLAATPALQARVTKIVIDQKVSPAFPLKEGGFQLFGTAGHYETFAGNAYGELDPNDPRNAIIQDIQLAPKNANGKVEYVARFFVVKPIDMSKASGLMWHDIPNRGRRVVIPPAERSAGDVGLSSGWQGDNAGNTVPGKDNDWVTVPIAKNPDGSPITGLVLGRIVNRSGTNSQPLIVQTNPLPYKPLTHDTTRATLVSRTHESIEGVVTGERTIASSDWAWAKCGGEHPPFPGTPDDNHICLKTGFDPKLLYQIVFTAKDPYVLGVGFAAFRDVGAFFKTAKQDDFGTANPLMEGAGVRWAISRGRSQSGNFLRGFLHLGFNEDEAGKAVHDGAWPIIAGRRIGMNFRWAQPDGVLELYQAGSEGPQWWVPWPDKARGLPARSILDRCNASKTCPKIIEHFGSAEVWGLKLTPEWVGTSADADIPLPPNVRRYYIPSTAHGGGIGGFSTSLAGSTLPPPDCPGNNYGLALLAANPLPHNETYSAIRSHFRNWVMNDTAPPPSRYPTLAGKHLVDATKEAMGFPTLPGIPATLPGKFINPVLDYDFGPAFNASDGSGVPTIMPPKIKQVIRTLVPRVNADGNELGGVPVVLHDAPLGTYLGWNITAGGERPFHAGQICNYAGGMIPFTKTQAERAANHDPRLSLEERYGTHEGYIAAVRTAAQHAVKEGFLLPADAERLIKQAMASNVLK